MNSLEFSEFGPTTLEDWKKLVAKELGEKPYSILQWHNKSGLDMEPYYVAPSGGTVSRPEVKSKSWEIAQAFDEANAEKINQAVLDGLMGGVQSIVLQQAGTKAMDIALKDVLLDIVSVHFKGDYTSLPDLLALCEKREVALKTWRGSLGWNAEDALSDLSNLKGAAMLAKDHFSLFRIFNVRAADQHHRGAAASQELTYALVVGYELLHQLTEAGLTIDEASAMIQFDLGVGSSYFTEIAKLRVLRSLWSKLIEAYQPQHACTKWTHVLAETSLFWHADQDHDTNLLRATTQAMSAVLGGADAVLVQPHDNRGMDGASSSSRYARNIQHLLIEESYLQEAAQAADGALYIREMENQLASLVWSEFLKLEAMPSFEVAMSTLKSEIEASSKEAKAQIESGQSVMIGVNKYQPKVKS